MSNRKKRLERIRKNPRNVSFDELRTLIEDYGFILKRVTGSHHVFQFERDDVVYRLVVPYQRPLKKDYVIEALEAIRKITTRYGDDDDD